MRRQLPVVVLCLALATGGLAATLTVPADYASIGDALTSVQPGDTILLDSGLYSGPGFDNLLCHRPGSVTLLAPHGPDKTEVALQSGTFAFIGDPSNDTLPPQLNLEGLSLSRGGTAISLESNGVLSVRNCRLAGHEVAVSAGGPASSVFLNDCLIENNDYAIVLSDSATALLGDNLFRDNYCALWAYPETSADIRRSMFVHHDWTLVFEGATAEISNSLLLYHFVGIKGSDSLGSDITVSCSNVFSQFTYNYSDTPDQTGLNGNISLDPLLCDSTIDTSLGVAGISPLLPDNNPCGQLIGHVHVGCCCVGKLGNVNYDVGDLVDIADIQALIDNLFLSLTPLACPGEGDLNYDEGIDITDLQILIDNQFLTLTPLGSCP